MTARRISLLWKALVGVKQRPGGSFLGSVQGGYANVLASAGDLEEFTDKVKLALKELGLELIDLDETEVLPAELSQASVSDEIRMMAKTVREKGSVAFGTFYTFSESEEE